MKEFECEICEDTGAVAMSRTERACPCNGVPETPRCPFCKGKGSYGVVTIRDCPSCDKNIPEAQ